MKPTGIGASGTHRPGKGIHQNFFTTGATKGQVFIKSTSRERGNNTSRTSSIKKTKTSVVVKNFGGNIGQNQIGKVRVSSGGRVKPGTTNYPEKKLKYLLHDKEKAKRKSGGGSHSRNHIFQMPSGSNTGRSYNKSNTREYSPNNVSKSPKQLNKKSRNQNRIGGSQTHVAPKRRPSKKYSREQEVYKSIKNPEKLKKDSIFLMYQQYPRMTKTNQMNQSNSRQFSGLSPKTVKNMMKSSNSGISGFEKYKMKVNPSKHQEQRNSTDRKFTSYLNSIASDGSKSREDLKYVPVENISLFDESNAPLSARVPNNTGPLTARGVANLEHYVSAIPFFKNFRYIKVFKKWAAYVRRQKYLQKRQELAMNLPWGKPYFTSCISGIVEPLNTIRYCSPLIEVRSKNIYSKKNNGYQGFIIQCSNKQRQTMSRLNREFLKVLKAIERLVKFKKTLAKPSRKYREEKDYAISMVNKMLGYALTSAVFSIRDLIRNQQNELYRLLSPTKDSPNIKFEFQMEFDHNGNVITDPTFEDYTIHLMNLYDSIRKVVVTDKQVEEFLFDIVSIAREELGKDQGYCIQPMDYIKRKSFSKLEKDSLEKYIGNNNKKVNEYLYQFKSFSSIHELLTDTETHFQTLKKCQYERFKQVLSKVEKFHRNVDQIPNYSISIDCIMLNMPAFKHYVSNMPGTVMNNINEIMVKFLKAESGELYQKLIDYIQTFSHETVELTQYIEQSNAYRKLKNEFPALEKRVENLESVASLFDTAVLSQIQTEFNTNKSSHSESIPNKSVMVTESIIEVRKCLDLLPELFMKVKQDLDKGRDNLATKVISTSKVLLDMIEKFEAAYIENFHRRASTKKPKEILANVQAKSKTLDEIEKKANLFKDSLEFLKSEGERRVDELYPDLNAFECHNRVQKVRKIHDCTLKAWEYIIMWQDNMSTIEKSSTKSIESIQSMINECVVFNESIKSECLELSLKFEPTISRMQYFQIELEFWGEIQQNYVKDRHWAEIFKLLKPELMHTRNITIKHILELPAKLYSEDIRQILDQAKREHKYQKLHERIRYNVSNIKLNVIKYKDYYILSEFDLASEQIEEDLISIESALGSIESIPYRDDLKEWQKKLSLMQNIIEKILEVQKAWLGLEPTFRNKCLKECLQEDFEKFQEYQSVYFNLIKECKESPNIYYMLYEQGKVYGETLERLSNNFSQLQKNIEEFIEAKRLAFPRLFFLNDTQFIEFLTKLKAQDNFDFYISQLFPGANGFFFKKSMQDVEIPPQIINDVSVLEEDEIDLPNTKKLTINSMQKNINVHVNEALTAPASRAYDYGNEKVLLKEVLGMVSVTKELFLFENKVKITNKPESWLQKVEQAMQDTVGKNINHAVASFPKQSLDEWILDHPQQIILTTIHLILTHEVNELFDEMKRSGGGHRYEGEEEESEEEENSQYFEEEATPKTPNTRDLIKHSKVSSMWEDRKSSNSYRSSLRMLQRRDESKMGSVADEKKELGFKEGYGKEFTPGRSIAQVIGSPHEKSQASEASKGEAPEQIDDRKKFAANMFGSDFDIDLVLADEKEDRDDVMRTLQEKSFRGLYLRLQFWINQICKSLHGKQKDINLDLPVVHRIIMKSIVCFLNYMRDVVFDLKQKGIDHGEHYEWQKQIRLTWNGRENGCKVDCGAWTTYQGNEYLGSLNRLALTPLTTKYFVFISSAFREKSAVLFRCIPDHTKAEDIFHEFSNVCTTPFKAYDCNQNMSMRHLMQYLNGAALASIWVFFEHIDKLNYINLQTFNKEIQMVQQQFIIAELSQDSSVITAHITVGNHSHSQAQKSIEQRFNPQRAAMNAAENKAARQEDIKIEDNFNDEGNPDQDEDASEDEDLLGGPSPPKHAFETRKRFSQEEDYTNKERPLDSDSEGNIFDSNNLEDFRGDIDKDLLEDMLEEEKNYESNRQKLPGPGGKNDSDIQIENPAKNQHEHVEAFQDQSSREKHQSKTDSNETGNDDGGKMNKICFGVFASISHEFILDNPQKADEISLSLQSAFRVISLTRPEYRVILKTLLKCEGIKNYEELGNNILEFVNSLKSYAPAGLTDKQFSFTYYDAQAIVKSIAYLTEENWKERRDKYLKLRDTRLTNLEEYTTDYRDKANLEEKKAETENMIDNMERNDRVNVE